jgi:hypothetical protein
MRLKFLAVCFCALAHFSLFSQKETRNNVYAEGLGIAGYYSLNYERFQPVTRNRSILIAASAGFSYMERHLDERWISFPIRLNICAGYKNFYGEIGMNYLPYYKKDYDYRHNQWYDKYFSDRCWFYHFGLRYQPKKKGVFLRSFVFPVKVKPENGGFIYHIDKGYYKLNHEGKKFTWWGGIDVGYSF